MYISSTMNFNNSTNFRHKFEKVRFGDIFLLYYIID